MASWIVGDVHGCWRTLCRLLERVAWTPGRDRLVLVGDLVNKGTGSLEVLRWAARHGDQVEVVLGNHDLHLLAVAAGVAEPRREDRLDRVLDAPDLGSLLDWLRGRPFVVLLDAWVVVHAGLWPTWELLQARTVADELHEAMAGPRWSGVLQALYGSGVRQWSDRLQGIDRLCAAASVLTRLRMVDGRGRARYGFTGPPDRAEEGWWPWYRCSRVVGSGVPVAFGHWARLGCRRLGGPLCLDSGCVYGGGLSALRVEDGHLETQPADPADLG